MKKEGTLGAATLLAIAAVVGFSVQTGPKPSEGGRADGTAATKRVKPTSAKPNAQNAGPGCSSLQDELQDFLEIQNLKPSLVVPKTCNASGGAPEEADSHPPQPELAQRTAHLKFVVATLPDPVHTHLPVLFDQFAVAIQEGAQDENYDFDSAWLPWDTEESSYALLEDQKKASDETERKEAQPGIILFRKSDVPITERYREGLIVFVVGEEATQGIHKAQFRNALAWIRALVPDGKLSEKQLAILGPTFSGSLPSLAELLSESNLVSQPDLKHAEISQALAVYSGSVSSDTAVKGFTQTFGQRVRFHSFVQSDAVILQRFCKYIKREQYSFQDSRVAIISEDETAYGSEELDGSKKEDDCLGKAVKLYYPRDISALRGAYQTTSLFNSGSSNQPVDPQRKNLPSDLADSAGKVYDSIRSYGGAQTPLNQEAFLLEIVAALQELRARYILLRSSNILDQLFLTNFLHRNYADGRIVIVGSDLMFIRERGSTGLNGVMTLSTYPLFPLERDWTEHQSLPADDRVFSGDTIEGTYVALRLLLNSARLNGSKSMEDGCHVSDDGAPFVPTVACTKEPPIPDYSPTFWTLKDQCGEMKKDNTDSIATTGEKCSYPGPATWLSVIGVNRYWPMASLTDPPVAPHHVDARIAERAADRDKDPLGRPQMPLSMKVGWLILLGFSAFHLWCCWEGSYTAKPAFRAHFASTGDPRHATLVFFGSCLVAFLGIVAGWGCGVFSRPAQGLSYSWFSLACVIIICLAGWGAVLANNFRSWCLAKKVWEDPSSRANLPIMTYRDFITWNYGSFGLFVAAIVLFGWFLVIPVEAQLVPENRVLTYWRAMHLTSGVSPIVPIFLFLIGLYQSVWYGLHGLALFGRDRPRLPLRQSLRLNGTTREEQEFLVMFSQQKAGIPIERAAMPLSGKVLGGSALFLGVALGIGWGIAAGVPVRSLSAESYAKIFVVFLLTCCTLALAESWRLYEVWGELRRLLAFLDLVTMRRTMSVLRGFSWESVWRMSGNVLEVRYKVMSRQIECMNHTIQSLEEYMKRSWDHPGARESLDALEQMRAATKKFATWYSQEYTNVCAGDLTRFGEFQKSVAHASGKLLAKLLVPAWRKEKESLLATPLAASAKDTKDEAAPGPFAQSPEAHIKNAEEFVCLNYLSFVQNILGRLRTMAITIVTLFLAATIATSTYPFDPRQGLSAVLIVLFVIAGVVIVKVYAEMHRDATLSHVTNTTPGELGTEFWFKIIGFGFAPLVTLLTRVFPGITDFVFSWLQPGVASLK